MASSINPDWIFGDGSPISVSIFANYLDYSDTYLYALLLVLVLMSGKTVIKAIRIMTGGDANKGDLIWDQLGGNITIIVSFMALSVPIVPLSLVGFNSTLSVSGLSVLLAGGYRWSDLFANEAAQKLVSLNPMTAPQMPLLRAQADSYFEGSNKAIEIARKNVEATGGAFDSASFRAQILHGAGVAYASAGLNNANTPPEELPKTMQDDLTNSRRMQDMWKNRPAAAMTECVGNTLLSDTAKDLITAQHEGGNLPLAKEWDGYYQAASAYLVGGNVKSVQPSNFGSSWAGSSAGGEAGSDIQLPPVTDILNGVNPHDIVLNGTAYMSAFSPGVSLEMLSLPLVTVKARLDGASDGLERANLQRLLAAAQARERALTAQQTYRNQISSAFESLAVGFSMANGQSNPSQEDLFQLAMKDAQGDGADLLRQEVPRRNLVARCQDYGNRVKATDLGFHLADIKTRYTDFVDSINDPTSSIRTVADGGWLKLGIYYLSTAESYRNAYSSAQALRDAAASHAGQYFSGDPVAVQATDARAAAEVTGTSAIVAGGALMAKGEAAGKGATNAILEAGNKASSKLGGMLGAVGRKAAWWGWLVDIAAFLGNFIPYLAFVFAVFWWFSRLVFYFFTAPFMVLFLGLRAGISQNLSIDFVAEILMKTGVFIFMPVIYVIGWAVTFFATAFLNVLMAATSGQTGAGATLKSLATFDMVGATMSSGIGNMVAKFFLTCAIGFILLKSEGWIHDFMVGIATHDADLNEAKPKGIT